MLHPIVTEGVVLIWLISYIFELIFITNQILNCLINL